MSTVERTRSSRRHLSRFLDPRLILLLLFLFHAGSSVVWLRLDNRPPSGETSQHLIRAIRVAEVLSQPSVDWPGRLAAASGGHPPLYYLVTAPVIWLVGPSADAMTLVNLFFLAVLLISTFIIVGRMLSNGGTGNSRYAGSSSRPVAALPRRFPGRWIALTVPK